MDALNHKHTLQAYFDGEGFARWQQIYGDGPIKGVRASVRQGHARVVELALEWLGTPEALTPTLSHGEGVGVRAVLDAGCGTGLLAVALAQRGWDVTAVDIAPQMAEATAARARAAGVGERVQATASDLDAVEGSFDTAVCLDVLIHYPATLFAPMLHGLANRTRGPLVFTYAPRETLLAALHWVGGKFPRGQRRTEIQMLPEAFVHATLAEAGMRVRRTKRVSVGFYHVALVEAEHL